MYIQTPFFMDKRRDNFTKYGKISNNQKIGGMRWSFGV